MAKNQISRDYLYSNTVNDALDTLMDGIQIAKVDNLKVKKKLDDNTIIYYAKGLTKSSKIQSKSKKLTKINKTKSRRKVK